MAPPAATDVEVHHLHHRATALQAREALLQEVADCDAHHLHHRAIAEDRHRDAVVGVVGLEIHAHCQFLLAAQGVLSAPHLPELATPGSEGLFCSISFSNMVANEGAKRLLRGLGLLRQGGHVTAGGAPQGGHGGGIGPSSTW